MSLPLQTRAKRVRLDQGLFVRELSSSLRRYPAVNPRVREPWGASKQRVGFLACKICQETEAACKGCWSLEAARLSRQSLVEGQLVTVYQTLLDANVAHRSLAAGCAAR